jgi:agmatinase
MSPKIQTIPFNFGGLPRNQSTWADARVVFLSVPYDLTSTYLSGSRRGPFAILEASTHMELYDEELGVETAKIGLCTLDPIEAASSGPEEMIRQIGEYAAPVLQADKFPVLLGGEHSVTLGLVHEVKKKHPALSFLQLDAHADLRAEYEGTPFSHACVARRLAELGPLVQVGIRSLSAAESVFLEGSSVKSLPWHSLAARPDWEEEAIRHLSSEVYVTIDLDVLDPAIMPATGTPEPGGLDWRTITRFLRKVAQERKIVGFDVVELAPIPGLVAPDFLAAKLIYRFLGEIFIRSLRQETIPANLKEK